MYTQRMKSAWQSVVRSSAKITYQCARLRNESRRFPSVRAVSRQVRSAKRRAWCSRIACHGQSSIIIAKDNTSPLFVHPKRSCASLGTELIGGEHSRNQTERERDVFVVVIVTASMASKIYVRLVHLEVCVSWIGFITSRNKLTL